jgi:hypothetical protein
VETTGAAIINLYKNPREKLQKIPFFFLTYGIISLTKYKGRFYAKIVIK